MRTSIFLTAFAAGATFCGLRALSVQVQNVIWQIGQFDQFSREFGHEFDPEDPHFNPVSRVGQSKTTIPAHASWN